MHLLYNIAVGQTFRSVRWAAMDKPEGLSLQRGVRRQARGVRRDFRVKKIDLRNFSLAELEEFALALGLQRYRGRQLFHWIYGKCVDSIDMMTDLSKESRELLSEKTYISSLQEERRQYSSDG